MVNQPCAIPSEQGGGGAHTSASPLTPFSAGADFSRADHHLAKSWSLIRCQTEVSGARMTACTHTGKTVQSRLSRGHRQAVDAQGRRLTETETKFPVAGEDMAYESCAGVRAERLIDRGRERERARRFGSQRRGERAGKDSPGQFKSALTAYKEVRLLTLAVVSGLERFERWTSVIAANAGELLTVRNLATTLSARRPYLPAEEASTGQGIV